MAAEAIKLRGFCLINTICSYPPIDEHVFHSDVLSSLHSTHLGLHKHTWLASKLCYPNQDIKYLPEGIT